MMPERPPPMADAYADSIPLLVIATSGPRSWHRRPAGDLHELKDQLGVMQSLAGWCRAVDSADEADALKMRSQFDIANDCLVPALVEQPESDNSVKQWRFVTKYCRMPIRPAVSKVGVSTQHLDLSRKAILAFVLHPETPAADHPD